MIAAHRAGAAGDGLLSFWQQTRLRAGEAQSSSSKPAPGEPVPWRQALEDLLAVGYGPQTDTRHASSAWVRARRRTTPSAGALYPFEVIAAVPGEGSWLWDLEAGRLVPCGLPALGPAELAAAGLVQAAGRRLDALLIFVGRPWLSMRKYRLRGYAYCHLDVGHAAANTALYATALGCSPTLHLRFSRRALSAGLGLDGLCREPLVVLSFTSPGTAAQPVPAAGPLPDPSPGPTAATRLELPDDQELLSWESLRGLLGFASHSAPAAGPGRATLLREPAAARREPLLPLPAGRPQPATAREWRGAILGRRSAKGFRGEPLSAAEIGELLAALRAADLAADLPPAGGPALAARLVARKVDGLAGVFAYSPADHALQRIGATADDPRPACMWQEVAGEAATLVIFHAPVGRLLAEGGYSAFAELHFGAALLAQRLYLAASRLGRVGMTCIGGFDGEECAALARLEAGEEALYVILLGVPDETAVKQDRLSVAYSHGYAVREG